jgi:hypothetical protein
MVRRHVFRFTQKAGIVLHDRHIRFVPGAGSRAQQIIAYILPLSTTRVCALKLGNLLIIQRYGSTPVRLFANKVVFRGGLMTTQASAAGTKISERGENVVNHTQGLT